MTDDLEKRIAALEQAFIAHLHVARIGVEPMMDQAEANSVLMDWLKGQQDDAQKT